MSNLFDVQPMLRSLGLILIGMAVQLFGLGLLIVDKKNDQSVVATKLSDDE